jgi:hypothetical protein
VSALRPPECHSGCIHTVSASTEHIKNRLAVIDEACMSLTCRLAVSLSPVKATGPCGFWIGSSAKAQPSVLLYAEPSSWITNRASCIDRTSRAGRAEVQPDRRCFCSRAYGVRKRARITAHAISGFNTRADAFCRMLRRIE